MSADPVFRLVVLCTGNRFRSPLAEILLRELTSDQSVDVSSCGTLELGPVPALAEALEAATGFGLDLSSHRGRSIREADLGTADLVLGFERHHVATAVVDGGAPPERTFTLPELISLLRDIDVQTSLDPVARARDAVARAHAARSGQSNFIDLSEVADPFGASRKVYRDTASRIDVLCGELAARLFGSSAGMRHVADEDEPGWFRRLVPR